MQRLMEQTPFLSLQAKFMLVTQKMLLAQSLQA